MLPLADDNQPLTKLLYEGSMASFYESLYEGEDKRLLDRKLPADADLTDRIDRGANLSLLR